MPTRGEAQGDTASPFEEEGGQLAEERDTASPSDDTAPLHQSYDLTTHHTGNAAGGRIAGELIGWRESSSLPKQSRRVLLGKKVASDLENIRGVLDVSMSLDDNLAKTSISAMCMSKGSSVIVSQLENGNGSSTAKLRGEKPSNLEDPHDLRQASGKNDNRDDIQRVPKPIRNAKRNRKRAGKYATDTEVEKPVFPAAEGVKESGGRSDELVADVDPVGSAPATQACTADRRNRLRDIKGAMSGNGGATIGSNYSSENTAFEGTLRDKLIMLCSMPKFEVFFATLILANTVVMAFQVQYRGLETGKQIEYYGIDRHAEEIWPGADVAFDILDWIFGVIFSIEIILKLGAFRIWFFRDLWNVLDFLVVAAWAVEAGSGKSGLPLDPMLLRLIRLVKLLRMLRLIRTMQGFDSLYIMITSLKGSVSALLWSTLMFLIVLLVIALLVFTFTEAYIIDKSNPIARRNLVYKYFGTFSRTGLTMFEMSLANWVPPSRALIENVSEWMLIFALVFKASLGFSVVKVIMGVFLQVTFKVAENDDIIMANRAARNIKTHTTKMSQLFKAADQDGNGRLDQEEFDKIVEDPVVVTWLSAMGFEAASFNSKDVYNLLLEGTNASDMNAEELVKGISRLKGPATSLNMTVLQRGNQATLENIKKISGKIDAYTGEVKQETSETPLSEECVEKPQGGGGGGRRVSIADQLFSVVSDHESNINLELPLHWRLHWRLQRVVTGFYFEIVFAVLIFANTLVMCAQAQYRGLQNGSELLRPNPALYANPTASTYDLCAASSEQPSTNATNTTKMLAAALANASAAASTSKTCLPWSDPADQVWPYAEDVFKCVEYFFSIMFTVEIVLKVIALGAKFPRDLWNILDTAIVGFWYVETFSSAALPFDPMIMRLFRLLRLLRMARLVKVFEKFDALYLMMTSIKGSLSALAWSALFLFVFQTLLALIIATLLEGWLRDDTIKADKELIFMYWGTFTRSILTLFEISLANFIPVTTAMMNNVSDFYLIFALVHKFCMGFAVVMVVTGVFVQETMKIAQTDNTIMLNQRARAAKLHYKKMSALFAVADSDGSGRLDREEFEQVCEDDSVVAWLAAMGINVSDAGKVHELICEKMGTDDLDAGELVRGMSFVRGEARNMDMAKLRKDTYALQDHVEELEQRVGKLLKAQTAKRRKQTADLTSPRFLN
eukprot:TRINITY_DN3312_c0_g1_i1.p1 TRINITY_DN3312_c0_g1~~TRINITY_DN3312_c0_g1_i1.p1  ORF type:complete len:1185 (+),score=225.05 TRINITY_DN3312_c0_g1_i1:132-3686(+)